MSIFFQTSSISGKKKPGKLTILSLQFALEKTHPGFAFCCDLRRHLCPLCAQRLPRCFEPTPPLAPNSWIWKMASLSSSSARMPLAGGLENCRSVLTVVLLFTVGFTLSPSLVLWTTAEGPAAVTSHHCSSQKSQQFSTLFTRTVVLNLFALCPIWSEWGLKPHYLCLFVVSDFRPVVRSVRRAGSLPLMWKYWDLTAASPHRHHNQVTQTRTHVHTLTQVKAWHAEIK